MTALGRLWRGLTRTAPASGRAGTGGTDSAAPVPIAPASLRRPADEHAPEPWHVTQETLHLLAPVDAWVLAWNASKHHRDTFSFGAAFPDVPDEDRRWLRGRIDELDALAGRWCATEWGRDGGEPSNVFVDRMAVRFPECSRWAIGEVLDWNMFLSR